ncbi:MAG: hypothetical protein IAG10_26885 [Planctomycetaceae bacterium]|nr:hypothetical protein [Planctomycetaceae bacterium]
MSLLLGSTFVSLGTVINAADEPAKAKEGEKPKENLGQRRDGEVGRNEELSFLQAKVSSQMSELEERMFRLSDALKGLEPENASRLLIGLKYAREELIQLQMKEIQTALATLKYNDAAVEQKELITKLHRLEQLLLSPDLDFQLQLERLRLMRDLLRRLDAAIQEEERERSASDQSAEFAEALKALRPRLASLSELIQRQTEHNQASEKMFGVTPVEENADDSAAADALSALNVQTEPTEKPSASDIDSLAKAQQETRQSSKPLEEKTPVIAEAGKNMERATEQLNGTRPSDAYPHQMQALRLLKKARDAMQAEERELEDAISERKFQEMRRDQSNNRKTTDGISEAAVQLGDSGAASRAELAKAAANMMSAEGSLGSRLPYAAADSQDDAVESLKLARAKLAAESEKLLNRLRAEIKKRTIEGIVQMLEGQIVIRQSTERLGPRLKDSARSVLNSVVALATAENKLIVIGAGLTARVEETEFGIALPAALRSVTDGMIEVKERLAVADASADVVVIEKQIEEDLQTLLDAMKQLPSSRGGNGRSGNSRSDRERQLNQIIAELKMVRMLQVRVNRDTKDVDGRRPAESRDVPAVLTRRIEALQGRQEDVHDVTERIAIERAEDLNQ